jgi:hypothetical protein
VEGFEPSSSETRFEDLRRVGRASRGALAAVRSSNTPKGRLGGEVVSACGREQVARINPMGGRATRERSSPVGWRKALERLQVQESIGLAARFTPGGRQRTPARYQALKSGLRSTFGWDGGDGTRVAGVERRDGFVRRETL